MAHQANGNAARRPHKDAAASRPVGGGDTENSMPTLLPNLRSSAAKEQKEEPPKIAEIHSARGADRVINRTFFSGGWREGHATLYWQWNEEDCLGEGAFGRVFKARCVQSKRIVAVKQIVKSLIGETDQLFAEIRILSELDHPNILRFFEAFHNSKHIHVITEICLGGSLLCWLERVQGDLSFAARVTREVTGALAHCHARNICHRDLKLENVLMVRDAIDSPVRLADFGLAKRWSKRILEQRGRIIAERCQEAHLAKKLFANGETCASPMVTAQSERMVCLTSFKGTAEFMAPEVLRILDSQVNPLSSGALLNSPFYDFRCDIWSLGVMLHLLLTGRDPYTLEEVSAHVAEGKPLAEVCLTELKQDVRKVISDVEQVELPDPDVAGVSEADAEEFVRLCLKPDFRERPGAEALLRCRFITPGMAKPPEAVAELLRRVSGYKELSLFKRAALTAAVRYMGAWEFEQLRSLFQKVDRENLGVISIAALREAVGRLIEEEAEPSDVCCAASTSSGGSSADMEAEMHAVDSDQSGLIDFTEFLAAAMDRRIEEKPGLALAAFRALDMDGDGTLSKKELAYALDSARLAEETMRRGDKNGDEELSFEEFVELLRCG